MIRFQTQRLLLGAILASGLSTAAWAQVGTESHSRDPAHADTAGKLDRAGDWQRDRADDRIDRRASLTVLRENFGLRVRPLQRDQAASHDLKPGVGLVVEEVTASSVAANGGIQKGDVIFQVGDQWAINADQLATLLAMQEAGNGFEIKVRRGNDRVDLDFEFDQAALDTMNRSYQTAMGAPDQRTDRAMDTGVGQKDDVADRHNPMIIPEKFDFKDDQHSIQIRTEDGVKKLVVKDKDDNVLFDGPYNTPSERDALPAEVKSKVERVLREKVE